MFISFVYQETTNFFPEDVRKNKKSIFNHEDIRMYKNIKNIKKWIPQKSKDVAINVGLLSIILFVLDNIL